MRRAFEDSLSLLAGVGVGTALMFLLDPDKGQERRRNLAKQTRYAWDEASEAVSDAGQRIADTARSAWSEYGSDLNDRVDDGADSINRYADQIKSAALAGASQYRPDFARMRRRLDSAIHSARERLGNRVSGRSRSDYVAPIAGYTAGGVALVALGVGVAYLFDPDRGNARRAYLADKSSSIFNEAGQFMRRTGRHLSNKMYGTAMEATRPLRRFRERHSTQQETNSGPQQSSSGPECFRTDAPSAL